MCAKYSLLSAPRVMHLGKHSRCQLLYLVFVGNNKKKCTRKYCQLRKRAFLMGCIIFLLKFHWVPSFQIFICFTDSEMIFQFGLCTVWPHLNMCIRKYIYWTDRSCSCHSVILLLETTPSLPLAE